MKTLPTITPDLRVNEVIRRYPGTVRVFHQFGLDACCGGDRTIAEAATAHGLDLKSVLQALDGSATDPVSP